MRVRQAGFVPGLRDDERRQGRKDCFGRLVGVDPELDGLGEVQAEHAHHGFGVDDIAAADEIEVAVIVADFVDQGLDPVDGTQGNRYCFHGKSSFGMALNLS